MDSRFALLLACFFLSGFAALLYQTAWTRELSFVFGTSELAVAAVLAAYMGGLAAGAAAAARFATRLRRPILAYGILELAIAVCALLVPLEIRGINAVYVGLVGGGQDLSLSAAGSTTFFQLAAAFAVLLPPTAFMGATLPLLARHAVRREEEIGPRVGILYTVNTAGAIAGTTLAAFWLMPELGLRRTVWIGAALNGLVFVLAAQLARRSPLPEGADAYGTASHAALADREASDPASASRGRWILPVVALSGVVSFAYEVLWTRLLGYLLGASIHAFATMLASFLLGIALGSAVAARLATTRARAALGFSVAQLGIAVTSYATFVLADRLPELAVWLGAGPAEPLASAGVAVATLLPVTLCIGATFPFAVRILARGPEQAAAATARVYAWNTVGAIAGALGAGFYLLPELEYDGTMTFGIVVSLCLAVVAALAPRPRRLVPAALAGAALLALILAPLATPTSFLMWTSLTQRPGLGEPLFMAVGRTGDVRLTLWRGRYYIATNGLPEAAVDAKGMLPHVTVARWLTILPALLRPEARSMLVVGLGGGVAIEMVPRSIETIDVIELEPEVLAANRYMAPYRENDPLADPRVRVHLGDARGTLQLTDRRFDAIVSQPSHPWTAGASHLYTREFFQLVRSRLSDDGVFLQWIGARFIDEPLLRSILATLRDVFAHVELYRPHVNGLLFVASGAPLDGLSGAARALASDPDDLARLGLHELEDFAHAWTLAESGVRTLAEGAPLNTDDHNRLAARAARLGPASLDRAGTADLLGPHDPMYRDAGLDLPAVIRMLTSLAQAPRAAELARARTGATREAALGWLELGAGRSQAAGRHFERALSLAPGDADSLTGLIVANKGPIARREAVPALDEAALPPAHAALIGGWRLFAAGEWEAAAALDPALASVGPDEALFEFATRVRIRQRLALGDATSAAEAEALAAILLLRRWNPFDALLHARAAAFAEHPNVALGSLHRLADSLTPDRRGLKLAEHSLEIADLLPPDLVSELREFLTPPERATVPAPGPTD